MIFAVVGPSGAGKDTLIDGVIAARPDLRRMRRVITRPSASGGEDFEGVSDPEFQRRLTAGDFALYWQAHGLHYAIPRSQLEMPGDAIFNGSRAALGQALGRVRDLVVVLVTAPDEVLAHRLAARGREAEHDIRARLSRAAFCLPAGITPRVVVNDGTAEVGIARLLAALQPVSA